MSLPFASNALLGLGAAIFWGGGDFGGGMGVKRMGGTVRGALLVVLLGHVLSLAIVLSIAAAGGSPLPHAHALLIGACGGCISSLALMAFYIALSEGHMGAAAAISGLLCAAIPAIWSGMTEGAPGLSRVVGFLLAAVAIWRIASPGSSSTDTDLLYEPGDKPHAANHRASLLAVLGGIGFGIYFITLKYAGQDGVLHSMEASRLGSSLTCAVALLLLSRTSADSLKPARKTLVWIFTGALLDTAGNLMFIAATRSGRLDVAAVIASLYPASTILLAALILRERTTRRQMIGMLLALPAVVMITL